MANGGLLAGIMNPAQVDVLGSMDKGRERQAKQMAGEILGEQIGGKIGALANLNPEMGIKIAELTNTPINDKGRIDNLLGTNIMVSQLWDAGHKDEALRTLEKQINFTESKTHEKAEALRLAYDDLSAGGQGESGQGFLAVGRKINPLNKPVSAKDKALTEETKAKTEKLKAETTNLITPTVKTEDQLKINELKLKIQNQKALVTERNQKAVNAAEQKDQTSMAQAFEAGGAITNIDDLLKDDAFEDIYGVGDKFIPTIWSGAVALEAKRDQVVGLLSLESRQKLKGQGTISEGEAKTLAQSATVLANPGIDEVTAKNELVKVRSIFKRAEQRAMKNPAAKAAIEEDRRQNELLKRLPEGSYSNGDGTFTMPNGTIVEPE